MAKETKEKSSREFKERMALIEAQKIADELRHSFKMEELEMERHNSKRLHDEILERGRIQRAEDRKLFYEKKNWKMYSN